MAQDSDEIVVGANGAVRVAPVGTTAPADESASPAAGWVDLGFTSEDGVTVRDGKTLEVINGWPSFYALRRIVTARDFSVVFALRQWDAATVKLAFGGGTIAASSGTGHTKYTPPAPEDLDERALMVDWTDGARDYRLIIPRGMVTDNVETKIARNAAADLPITFSVLSSGGSAPWYLLTNDAALPVDA